MTLTERLRDWLTANCDVKADTEDGEFKKAAGEAFASGKLTAEKYMELSKDEDEDMDEFVKEFKTIGDKLGELTKLLKPDTDVEKAAKEKAAKEKAEKEDEEKEDEEKAEKEATGKPKGEKVVSNLSKMIARFGGVVVEPNEDPVIRVKEAVEQYDDTKSALSFPATTKAGRPHPMAGRPVKDFGERGHVIDSASDRDKAVSGAYVKLLCSTARSRGSRSIGWSMLPQHDKELLYYAMDNMKWGGYSGNGDDRFADIIDRKLYEGEKQALIDDAVSGGLEAAPIVFDDQVIQAPLLHGELFPLVNVVPLDRGRRIEGVVTGTVTGGWGGIDDTAITLFNTANYVSAFDTTIFRWEGAIRIGLDFLSDTPIDFGAHVTSQYGERLLEDLDDVIAVGNGATQPTGIMNTPAGLTTVAWGGATSIGNYESLMFGVHKRELRPNVDSSAVFCGTYTSYQRAKAIPVGAADARRLSNTVSTPNYRDYSWMDRPFKINESLANAQLFFAILARYRMYRRRGLVIRTSTEGDTLIRRNEMLMVAQCRYGGQLERGACGAVTTTAPA